MIDEITPTAMLVLWAAVAFGSIIPVIPTGAVVSAAAVIAGHDHVWELVPVVAVGALGAYCGDLVTYGALSAFGTPLARRVGWLDEHDEQSRLTRLREQIEGHEVRALVLSRLVPAGRVPMLLVAALTGYPWLRYTSAAAVATLLWAAFLRRHRAARRHRPSTTPPRRSSRRWRSPSSRACCPTWSGGCATGSRPTDSPRRRDVADHRVSAQLRSLSDNHCLAACS